MFAVVEFPNKSVKVVPTCWLKGDNYYWSYLNESSILDGKMAENPDIDGTLLNVKIKALDSTLKEARQSLQNYIEAKQKGKSKTKGGQTSQNSSFTEATTEDVDGGSDDDAESENEDVELAAEKVSELDISGRSDTLEEARESLEEQRAEQASRKTKGGQTSQNSSFTEATDGGSPVPSDDSVSKNEGDELARIGERVSKLNVSGRSEGLPSGSNVKSEAIIFTVHLPLKNEADLDLLEDYLKCTDVQEYLYGILSKIENEKFEKVITGMLSTLMDNELAKRFTWLGTSMKRPFELLKIVYILKRAVRSNKSFQDSKDTDIIDIIKKWLADAPSRAKSRAKSSKK